MATSPLHKITMLKYAMQTMKSRDVRYSPGYIRSIIYDIIYRFPAIKHDKYN